jgi:hypothetical protein
MIVNQLEDVMKHGPKPKDKTEAPATERRTGRLKMRRRAEEQLYPKLSNPKLK